MNSREWFDVEKEEEDGGCRHIKASIWHMGQ